jgi:hypothetical protein
LPSKALLKAVAKLEPRKVFESPHGIVFDDFLPEEAYQQEMDRLQGGKCRFLYETGREIDRSIGD